MPCKLEQECNSNCNCLDLTKINKINMNIKLIYMFVTLRRLLTYHGFISVVLINEV
ncbi:hypothetical protein THIOM_005458 [Candidatus Thiomargarita nelsonii]|uniref:Uncharacterized protein n=1 Tax=Candidatus Thiomargarita nelsonii TaxID=1003181 RepID=A0A176RT63_9GAMM|nr:hypothetical protein THIOM_005458 [Candidatus Thiomargarita nelsonii]